MKYAFYLLLIFVSISCADSQPKQTASEPEVKNDTTTYTAYSHLENRYNAFNSVMAVNAIADIENQHFRDYNSGRISQYYGTQWRKGAEIDVLDSISSKYDKYCSDLGTHPDSMHCTIYAVHALKNGLDSSLWQKVETKHSQIYGAHEHAGWSIAHILVKYFNWKAYLIISESSVEFDQCRKHFEKHKSYPVYKQPHIPLEELLVLGKQDSLIQDLLRQHEFGWGFSYQGWHTWVTRFNDIKECIWLGAPAKHYESYNLPLFRTTPFLEYLDYDSHVVVFPELDKQ